MNTKQLFIGFIARRIEHNKNCFIMCNGPTGSGKTMHSLRLAYELSNYFGTNFSIKDNVSFKFSELLKKMAYPQNTKKGTCFLFEEVGAFGGGASSREWQSQSNKFFFSFMQTARHRNQILILTCPSFTNLDKGVRELLHLNLLMWKIDYNKQISISKPLFIQVNAGTGLIFRKYQRYQLNGLRYVYNRLCMELPPEEMIEEYEKVKTKFTTELNNTIIAADKPKGMIRDGNINYDLMDLLIKSNWKIEQISKVCKCCKKTVDNRKRYLNEQT